MSWHCFHGFWMIVELGALVLFVWLVWGLLHVRHDDAVSVLKVRYAKGEISKRRFEKLKGDLV